MSEHPKQIIDRVALRLTLRSFAGADDGDTLIEIVIAITILAITAAALLGAITTSIMSSADHRSLATDDVALRSEVSAVQYQVEQAQSPLYSTCATSYAITPPTLPSLYTASIGQIQYWGNPTTLSNALVGGTSYSSLPVNFLMSPMNAGDTIVIGSQTATVTAPAAISATPTSIAIQTSPGNTAPFVPTSSYPVNTWLYDEVFTTYCSPAALASGSPLQGNDVQELPIEVTAPNGISDSDSIVVRNPT